MIVQHSPPTPAATAQQQLQVVGQLVSQSAIIIDLLRYTDIPVLYNFHCPKKNDQNSCKGLDSQILRAFTI